MKKMLIYVVVGVLAVLLLLLGTVMVLYNTADMGEPEGLVPTPDQSVQSDSTGRYIGPHFLRKSESGLWEMRVAGEAYERGELAGYLCRDLLYYQEKVFIDQIRELVPSDRYLTFLRYVIVLFNRNLGANVPLEYRREIAGIAQSCTHEYDVIGTPYQRQINYHSAHDLGHALQDYMLVGCSSFAAWGETTADSALLVGRNFDFYMGEDFARNKLVSFVAPDQGYRFATVGWAGMCGVLSGMNETGLTVTINAAKSSVPTSSATPISLLAREILQYAATIDEAYAIAKRRKTFVSEALLVASATDGRAAVIEKAVDTIALYRPEDNVLVCTNHYQSETFRNDRRNVENIATTDSPYRHARLKQLIGRAAPLTPQVAAGILRDRNGMDDAELGFCNEMAVNQLIAHHSVIFRPADRLMWVSSAPWQCGKYVCYDLNKVFADSTDGRSELSVPALEIAADTFLQTSDYRRVLCYKALTPRLVKAAQKGIVVSDEDLETYEQSNPRFFYTHEVLGDYLLSRGDRTGALRHWRQALQLPVPKQAERQRIEEKINKNSSH